MKTGSELQTFFYPKNIAVIGVSPNRANLGKNIVFNLLTFGYKGEILSVGLEEGVVFGQRIYRSLDRIDHEIDLAVILTPANTIPGILNECGKKGIRHVVIESGGFSEMGQDRIAIERECQAAAKANGIRFIGPNGIGVTNLENGLALPFMPLQRDLPLGKVSILAQSGGVGLSYLSFMAEERIGLNKFVSMGNKLDVNENELLSYLINDPGTEIILVYLEGFTHAREFMEIAATSDKPILVHKSNRFQSSAKIAHSHTAALFADDKLVDHALEQAGCVRVNTMPDALDYIKILTLPPLKGRRLAIVSRSGGHAVITTDACGHYGFDLPAFPTEFLHRIENRVRANVIHLQNPLDLGDLFDLAFYENIVEELLKWEDIDGVLLGHGYRRGYEQEDSRKLIRKMEQLVQRYQKPVAIVIFTEAVEMDYLKRHSNMPIFSAPENAMRAIHFSHKWSSTKKSSDQKTSIIIDNSPIEGILKKAVGRDYLYLNESLKLLALAGMRIAEFRQARSAGEAVDAWKAFGKKAVALKINTPHISHKTDRGGVKLNLKSKAHIERAFDGIKESVSEPDLEVLVQPMVSEGREMILGGRRDAVFGPIIMFGLGGIFVEALEDVSWRLAPIDPYDAKAMIAGIRGGKVLEGIRGAAPSDREALEECLLRLSQLLVDFPVIREIDLNPVMAAAVGKGATVLDARIILKKKK